MTYAVGKHGDADLPIATDLRHGDNQRAEALHLEALRLRQLLGDHRAIIEELEAIATYVLDQGRNTPGGDATRGGHPLADRNGIPAPPRDPKR